MLSRTDCLRLAVLACVALQGCKTLNLPVDGSFIITKETEDEVRAVSADEAHFTYRTFDEESGGDLKFWTAALTKNLVDGRGYVLVSATDVKTGGGMQGRELLFETTVRGRAMKYLVALFVEKKHVTTFPMRRKEVSEIHVLEYTAEKAVFDAHAAQVRASVQKL